MVFIHITLPRKHAADWLDRIGGDLGALEKGGGPRSIELKLSRAALRDLIADAAYYAENMGPENTGDIDYRPAARRCLVALQTKGWHQK